MSTQKKTTAQHSPAESNVRILGPKDFPSAAEYADRENARDLALCVRALAQNGRQGTVGCKSRGELAFSNKKPWRQKGTGRARAGSRRSPLWRKGGVIFGPQPRVRTLKVNRKQKQNVLVSLFNQSLEQGKIAMLDWMLSGDRPKTSFAYAALKAAGLESKNVILFVAHDDFQTQASFGNMPRVRMLSFDQPNAHALAQGDCWLFLKKDAEAFNNMVGLWI